MRTDEETVDNVSVWWTPSPGFYNIGDTTENLTFIIGGQNFTNATNQTGNATTSPTDTKDEGGGGPYEIWQAVIIAIILGLMCIGTIVGNILVCMAVGLVRRLRTPSNLLIVSLAISDLLVALLVMPFASVLQIQGKWIFGQVLCDLWTSLDVLLCTASILNLCMISVDRYFAITRPLQYAMKRTPKRMALMITIVWSLSALISIPPMFGFKPPPVEGECNISQEIAYQIYATLGAFYLPLGVMIGVYVKIYFVSVRLAEAEHKSQAQGGMTAPPGQESLLHPLPPIKLHEENHNWPNGDLSLKKEHEIYTELTACTQKPKQSRLHFLKKCPCKIKKIKSGHRESKATKTLGVIMGAFTLCWLPFFIFALIAPICGESCASVPGWVPDFFMWLGYANSFLNPVIYARFNRDFRTPFKEILLFRCRNINIRLRSESYAEQYGSPDMVHSHSHIHGGHSINYHDNSPRPSQDTARNSQSDTPRTSAATIIRLDERGLPAVSTLTHGNGNPIKRPEGESVV